MKRLVPAVESPPFPLAADVTADVAVALEQAIRHNRAAEAHLRAAVGACMAALRGQGMSPESALLTMKALIRFTAIEHPPHGQEKSRWAADSWMEDIVRWSIIEYFRAD